MIAAPTWATTKEAVLAQLLSDLKALAAMHGSIATLPPRSCELKSGIAVSQDLKLKH